MDLVELLNKAVELKASDVHITVNLSPIARINGKFQKLSQDLLTNNDVYNLASQITNEKIIHKIDEQGEADFSVSLPNKHRIRVNVYKQRGNYAMAIRIIPNEIPKFEELKLPNAIKEFVNKQKGLVLITGPTGSGKSSTLASLIDLINEKYSDNPELLQKIITIMNTITNDNIDDFNNNFLNAIDTSEYQKEYSNIKSLINTIDISDNKLLNIINSVLLSFYKSTLLTLIDNQYESPILNNILNIFNEIAEQTIDEFDEEFKEKIISNYPDEFNIIQTLIN